jgi:hypothetical protein
MCASNSRPSGELRVSRQRSMVVTRLYASLCVENVGALSLLSIFQSSMPMPSPPPAVNSIRQRFVRTITLLAALVYSSNLWDARVCA